MALRRLSSGSVASAVAKINAAAAERSPVRNGDGSVRSFKSNTNTPRTPYIEQQLDELIEDDQPLSFDAVESLHSEAKSSSTSPHPAAAGMQVGGTSIASYGWDPRPSLGTHPGISTASYDRPPSVSSKQMHSPPTGSSNRILSSSTADSSGNTHSHQRSSTNSVSTLGFPMSISDEESDHWSSRIESSAALRHSLAHLSIPDRNSVFQDDLRSSNDPNSPFGGVVLLRSTSDQHCDANSLNVRRGKSARTNTRSTKNNNVGNNPGLTQSTCDMESEEDEAWEEGEEDGGGGFGESGFIGRHSPQESLDGNGLLGLQGDYGYDSERSGDYDDEASDGDGSHSEDSASLQSEQENWDLDLELPHNAPDAATNAYKDILTGKKTPYNAQTDESSSETEHESLLDFLKLTVQKTLFPAGASQLSSPRDINSNALDQSEDSAEQDTLNNNNLATNANTNSNSGSGTSNNFIGNSTTNVANNVPRTASTPSLSSRSHNNEAYETEGHNVEIANPHLRGLLDWVDASTSSLHAVLSNANSNKDCNAHTLLTSEVAVEPLHIDRLMDACEVLPCSDTCIRTLEAVSKYLRGVCNLHSSLLGALHSANGVSDSASDFEARLSSTSGNMKMRRTASLGETRASNGSNTNANATTINNNNSTSMKQSTSNVFNIASPISFPANDAVYGDLTGTRIDRIYDWCDDILQEQLVATTAALGAGYRKLLEINTRHSAREAASRPNLGSSSRNNSGSASNSSHWLNMGMVALRDPVYVPGIHATSTNASGYSKISSTQSDDDTLIHESFRLSSNLISLYRLQVNMLEIRIHMYDSFELVACMELLQKISEELEKVTSTLFAALRRVLPPVEACSAEQLALVTQLDTLTTVANDLMGCCFSIKILAICSVSPISYASLPETCQRVTTSANDLAKLNSFDCVSNSGSAELKGSVGKSVSSVRNTYNVIYELTLGTHFLDLMLLIPSPSVVRSKLCIAAYTYLQKLKKKQLPWQSSDYKLVSIRQHLESFANMFNIYHTADAFGLNYSEMENNTFTLTLVEVESSIIQSFSEVFGTLDQYRIVQLLLYEGGCELLPTVQRDLTGAAAFLHKAAPRPTLPTNNTNNMNPHINSNSTQYHDTCESDISDPSSCRVFATFSSMKHVFKHTPAALNFDRSIQLVRRRPTFTPQLPTIVSCSIGDSLSGKAGAEAAASKTSASLALLQPDPIDVLRKPAKHGLSYSIRYELFHFLYQILFKLAQSIVEMSPNVALDTYQMCILLLAHLRHGSDKARVEKIAAMLAVKVGRRDAAIWHGEAVLKNLSRGDNINEMLYMTDLLSSQYSENAQYELAAKALFSAIAVLNRRHKSAHFRNSKPRSRRNSSMENVLLDSAAAAESTNSAMDFERALDPLLLKLGRLLLQFGCPDRAADTFQVLLSSLCERTDCLANDSKKVTVLSWLAEAYLELEDYGSVANVLGSIKNVRNLKLRKATTFSHGIEYVDGSDKSKTPPAQLTGSSTGVGAFFKNTLSRNGSREINSPQAPANPVLPPIIANNTTSESRSRLNSVGSSTSESILMSTSYDLAMSSRPASRGIANLGSRDSFDFDVPPKGVPTSAQSGLLGSHLRPLPPTPLSSSSNDFELPPRALPPTPNSVQRANSFIQESSFPTSTLVRRPLPATPLEKSSSRESVSSTGTIKKVSSGASAASSGGRKKPDLRIDVGSRLSAGSINADLQQELRIHDKQSNTLTTNSSTPKTSNLQIPLTTRSSSMRITPAGTKKRRKLVLQNLQPLHNSSSNSNLEVINGSLSNTSILFGNTLTNTGPDRNVLNNGTPNVAEGNNVTSPAGSSSSVASPLQPLHLHYLRNPQDSNLPLHCVTTEDIDLGILKARLHYKNKHYALALKCLLPTIMGVELTVIGADRAASPNSGSVKHNWSRQSLMELGEIYYLRGKIQLEAAKSSSDVSFPFTVGSAHLFHKVQDVLWVEEKHGQLSSSVINPSGKTNYKSVKAKHLSTDFTQRKFARSSLRRLAKAPNKTTTTMPNRAERSVSAQAPILSFTCRDAVRYSTAADLLHDAMKWFTRAREVAKLASDEIGAALASNLLAMCHLLPTFVPTALYQVPLEKSRDLSNSVAVTKDTKDTKRESKSRGHRLSLSRRTPMRLASVAEVQASMEFALEVNLHSCLPLPLIDSYLNLAEMCELTGNKSDAVAFWNETKELFLHLFADGALVPLVRRASMQFVRKITAVLNRIVRFIWTLDTPTANANLFLLDLQIVLSHEVERCVRRNAVKASHVSEWLPDVLDRLLPVNSGINSTATLATTDSVKRNPKSRFSRFFKRIFGSFNKKSDSPESNMDSVRSDDAPALRIITPPGSLRSADKPTINTPTSMRTVRTKSNTTFDSFIQRFGFDAHLDVRKFYNLMNHDLVSEKVYDFGWSKCVEHDSLLKPISNSPDSRPFSVSSVHSGASSLTAQVHYNAHSAESPGHNLITNIDVLVILNLRAKLDYQEKYKALDSARYIKDHVLRRGDLVIQMDSEEDYDLENLNNSADINNANSREEDASMEGGLLNRNNTSGLFPTQLLAKGGSSPRSGSSSKAGSFTNAQPLSPAIQSQVSSGSKALLDPLLDIPVDPFADFDWMDESFADYSPHSHSLQARALLDRQQSNSSALHISRRSKYKRFILGDDVAQFGSLFMPEFDEAHLYTTDEVKSSSNKHSNISSNSPTNSISTARNSNAPVPAADVDSTSAVNSEYLRSLDERAETILVQRAWRCYLLLQNAQWGYRDGKRSLGVLRNDVRSALSCLTLNMVRLRAFSRQYQPSMSEYDRLLPELAALPATISRLGQTSPIEEGTRKLEMEIMRNRNTPHAEEHVHRLKAVMKESKIRNPVLLQHRLPYFVFAVHIEDNLMLYRPHDGSKNVQKVGGAGFIAYTKDSNDDQRVAQQTAALMNTSFSSQMSFNSDTGLKAPAPTPVHPPLHNHASTIGIAQVGKKAQPGRTLEQKLSIMSLMSMLSGESNLDPEGGEPASAPVRGKAPLDTSRSSFFSSMPYVDCHDHNAFSSSEATSSHDSSWGHMSVQAGASAPSRKSLARAELEGSSLGSHSTIEAALIAGKPVFTAKEADLLYDLVVSAADSHCAGGREHRRTIFNDMKSATGVLSSSLQFFQNISETIKHHHQHHHQQLSQPKRPSLAGNDAKPTSNANSSASNVSGLRPEHSSSGKSGFVSEASESVTTHSMQSVGTDNSLAVSSMRKKGEEHTEAAHPAENNRFAPHREDSAGAHSSSFVALSASMSNMLGLFASSDSAEVNRKRSKGEGGFGDYDDDDDSSTKAPVKLVPLTLVCSHTAAALPWEALLMKTHGGAPVVRSLTLLSLCSQAYASTYCSIVSDHSLKVSSAPPTELALARGIVGPQWQQKATYVAVAYESRELPHSIAQDLRLGEEERRKRTARHSLTGLLQPHSHGPVADRVPPRREYFATLQPSGMSSPTAAKSKHSQYKAMLAEFENGSLPSASPLFGTDRHSLSFFGKGDMLVLGADCLSANSVSLHNETLPSARSFWKNLPSAAPLRRSLSSSALLSGCRIEAVSNTAFPLLILSYVDYLQVSDALSYLVCHRPDAVLVFAPLFVIESLAIEIKLSLDRWCKPEQMPSPAPSPEKATPLSSAHHLQGSIGNMGRSMSSGRFLLSSFLSMGHVNSSTEHSNSTLNFNDSQPHPATVSGQALMPPSAHSMGSSANGSSTTTLGAALGSMHRLLPKIVEESDINRSSSSSAHDALDQRHLSLKAHSQSSDDPDAMLDFDPSTPTNTNTTSSFANNKTSGNMTDRVSKNFTHNLTYAKSPHTPPPPAAPSHISSSSSSGASSRSRSVKSLRAKERTWVYHAVMSVVQDMQREHEVPIVVFI